MRFKPLMTLALLTLASAALFMTWNLGENRAFLLAFRGEKLWNLALIGATIGVSTVVFQTLTNNRILTPAVIGLDSLYLFIQVSLIYWLGGNGYHQLHPIGRFFANSLAMLLLAALLFLGLMPLLQRDLYRLLLLGVVFGVLCRNLEEFFGRLLEPAEYAFAQDLSFAQFDTVRFGGQLLWPATVVMLLALAHFWRKRHLLDVLALGREAAISLGVNYRREMTGLLLLVSLLVAVSTALVGPVLFFGLLLNALTYRLCPSSQHRLLLPVSALLGVLMLTLGQSLFEHLFHFKASLAVVVEGLGGLLFIHLLLRGKK